MAARLKVLLGAVQTMMSSGSGATVEEYRVLVAGHHQVEVNSSLMTFTPCFWRDLRHPLQLLRGPHPAHRVVGAAEDHQLAIVLGGDLIQQVKIDGVGVVPVDQGAAFYLPAIGLVAM